METAAKQPTQQLVVSEGVHAAAALVRIAAVDTAVITKIQVGELMQLYSLITCDFFLFFSVYMNSFCNLHYITGNISKLIPVFALFILSLICQETLDLVTNPTKLLFFNDKFLANCGSLALQSVASLCTALLTK